MPAVVPVFARLRRSILGAWLAVFYALAVLAGVLAPAPTIAGDAAVIGLLLCSGDVAREGGTPAPVGDLQHCQPCLVNPVGAAPPAWVSPVPIRFAASSTSAPSPAPAPSRGVRFGLPQSRAPPAA